MDVEDWKGLINKRRDRNNNLKREEEKAESEYIKSIMSNSGRIYPSEVFFREYRKDITNSNNHVNNNNNKVSSFLERTSFVSLLFFSLFGFTLSFLFVSPIEF